MSFFSPFHSKISFVPLVDYTSLARSPEDYFQNQLSTAAASVLSLLLQADAALSSSKNMVKGFISLMVELL